MADFKKELDWAIKSLGLSDWEFELEYQNRGKRPPWTGEIEDDVDGCCKPVARYKTAYMWIDPEGDNPIKVLFYEMIRVVMTDIGVDQNEHNCHQEFSWNMMSQIMVIAYSADVATQ